MAKLLPVFNLTEFRGEQSQTLQATLLLDAVDERIVAEGVLKVKISCGSGELAFAPCSFSYDVKSKGWWDSWPKSKGWKIQ